MVYSRRAAHRLFPVTHYASIFHADISLLLLTAHHTRDSVTALLLLLHVYCSILCAWLLLLHSDLLLHTNTHSYIPKYPWRLRGKAHKGNNRLSQSIRCVLLRRNSHENFYSLCVGAINSMVFDYFAATQS